MLTASFRAMDTDVDVALAEPCDAAAAAAAFASVEALFLLWDHALTRFSEESELSALNRACGRPFLASPLLFKAVSAALLAAEDSEGVFDPTVLDALLAAGYDKTFAIVSLTTPAEPPGRPRPTASAWRRIRLERKTRTILLPPGVHLDLGGIGKGMAVDAAASLLESFGSFFVNAGGDLRIAGEGDLNEGLRTEDSGLSGDRDLTPRPPSLERKGEIDGNEEIVHGGAPLPAADREGVSSTSGRPPASRLTPHASRPSEPWLVGVQNPFDPGADLALIAPRDCAVATSSILRRRWQRGGVERHHLIDPRTGTSAETDLAAVTVVAPTAAAADVLAKVALILGRRTGRAFVESRGASCLLVGLDRAVDVSPAFPLATP